MILFNPDIFKLRTGKDVGRACRFNSIIEKYCADLGKKKKKPTDRNHLKK